MCEINYFDLPSHLGTYKHRYIVLVNQIYFECKDKGYENKTILDIGCGTGIASLIHPQQQIREISTIFWGVEPDTEVSIPCYFDNVWLSNLEYSDIPTESVDIAYSYMVLEHVANPKTFMEAIYRILKPGGVFLAITINLNSFFGRISHLSHQLKIQRQILAYLRGREIVDEYHYPAIYKLNTPSQIEYITNSVLTSAFTFDFTMLENGEFLPYFPKLVEIFGKTILKFSFSYPKFSTTLFVRIQKN